MNNTTYPDRERVKFLVVRDGEPAPRETPVLPRSPGKDSGRVSGTERSDL